MLYLNILNYNSFDNSYNILENSLSNKNSTK